MEIRSDGPHGSTGVHIGTMFRFKGLEYQRMIIAGVAAGLVPREGVNGLRDTDPVRHGRAPRHRRRELWPHTMGGSAIAERPQLTAPGRPSAA
ncbi:helicase [Streptomyces bottropensis ATCC 25435]|uniref:Helicase n=1 Tax=Streptomyces bottropensis ATCC 25435 TaxID=1054862 RepID=M3EH83_9ACTN|nr:helicase [Streptomyces bottropensis ATCC 25435]